MRTISRIRAGLLALAIAGGLWAPIVFAQAKPAATAPATMPAAVAPVAATSPATAPTAASAPAKKISVDELLPKDAVTLNFDGVPIRDALMDMGKLYGFEVRNVFDFAAPTVKDGVETEELQRITLVGSKLTARQALNTMNGLLLVIGYSLSETVYGDPPRVRVSVLLSSRDTTRIQVYYGQDPTEIPEGEAIRTQVMTLGRVDPAQAKDDIETMLGKTDITVNQTAKQLIMTDTGTHVKQAAQWLMLMEKKADKGGK